MRSFVVYTIMIKNDQRNRIHDLTIVSLLRIKYWLKNQSATAKDVAIPDELIESVMRVKPSLAIKEFMEGVYSTESDDVDVEDIDED